MKSAERSLPSADGAHRTTNGAADAQGGFQLDPPSAAAIYVAAAFLLLAGYTAVFALTLSTDVGTSVGTAAANVVPLALLSAAFYRLLRDVILKRSVLIQLSLHLMLAPAFAFAWYLLTLVGLALQRVAAGQAFAMGQFSGIALVWQLFQGLVLYALVAACTYALRGGRAAAAVQIVDGGPALERWLTKKGDELVPVSVDDVVCIRGAQDYSEVATRDGRTHLVRLSLGEFERRLPRQRFVRVHRSTIVGLAHLVRAEPVGSGRYVLHMSGGSAVEASRSGVQALRELVI